MRRKDITIGDLSTATGVKIETIRYYEKIGLMPDPGRSDGGHRIYSPSHIRRLAFIRRSRELGFSLGDIRALTGLEDRAPSCEDVHELTLHHLGDIRRKIADLKKLERTLSKISSECTKTDTPECPIIDALSAAPVRRR